MWKFLKSLFAPTVDKLIADLTNKVEQLHAVAELHAVEKAAQTKIVTEAQAAIAFAESEYARAKSIAGKITALVS